MNTPKKIKLDKDKIISQLSELPKIARRDDWKFDYDSELDELVFGKKIIPKGYFLFNVNNEINLFLNQNSKVSGIFIEYFKNNYLEHNKEYKNIFKNTESDKTLEKKDKDENQLIKKGLENKLALEAIESLFHKGNLITAI